MLLSDLNSKNYPTDKIIDSNLLVLYQRVKLVEAFWMASGGQEFKVTSGLRSRAQQDQMIKAGKSTAKFSKHLMGMAVDIYDPDGAIKNWLWQHPHILADAHLWCERMEYTHNWVHFQTAMPGSGNRWFIP